ncbi:MAG: NADH-quinone oxidoreductase subunit N [Parachlamydia sp.]|jgi:NADH-quinone oxidoreductase subunit N|nr:NADH-quinone oxidoreductase subunit N [Parachlamydia sp.]
MTPLNLADIASIGPLFILLMGALILILWESFASLPAKKWTYWIAVATILLSLAFALNKPDVSHPMLTPWINDDAAAHFFTALFLCIGFAAVFLSASFFRQFSATQGEYYFLLIAALFGLLLIASAADFLILFIGIETLSISLYILCGYMKKWELSHESAFKYFIMGSIAAAFLLYGIALIYGATGTTRLDALLPAWQQLQGAQQILFASGIAFITLGLAFEAALVPFHVWAPDVYEGAPTPVTAFMSVGTKAGAFAAFIRVFMEALPHFDPAWNQALAIIIILTLVYANFAALRQTHLRRFFAYSGISHAGFLLMPVLVGTPEAFLSLQFYLIIYSAATLGCFAVLAYFDRHSHGILLEDVRGLFYRAPWLAALLSLCLLTLAGIPPTAGFLAKFFVFKVAFQAGYYGLVIVGLMTTLLSAYYYLRIVSLLFVHADQKELNKTWQAGLVGTAAFALIVLFTIYPSIIQA